jgi:hypothetical protein
MRWKLLRRRLSVSAPRVIVRSSLPWPLRWAVAALALGFCGAIALWAFEFGKGIAGLDRTSRQELVQLRGEMTRLREEHAQARQIAETADSLLKTERITQERLARQLRQLDEEKQALRADLDFFNRLLPTAPGEGLQLRGLQAQALTPGQLRFQMLVVQNGKPVSDFRGRYELVIGGQLDGKPWSQVQPGGARSLQVRQYARVEGLIDHPVTAVIKTLQARVVDERGATRAVQTVKL